MASDFDASRSLAPIGLCVLALIAGAWTAHLEVFPYESLMEPPFRAARAYIERALVEPPATSQHWTLREGEPRGVSRPAPGRSWGEYTVYTSYGAPAVYMIDHCGAVAHVWHAPFRSVWPEPSHIRRPVPDSQIRIGAFDVTAGGEITATFKAEGDTPYGYGVARLDADSDVL
ncbi:MAG: hypothetical protein ABEL76_10475, partial [Bradymonadaceae bacterium]